MVLMEYKMGNQPGITYFHRFQIFVFACKAALCVFIVILVIGSSASSYFLFFFVEVIISYNRIVTFLHRTK